MAVACYANPFPAFQPAMRIITAVSNSNPVSITTSFAHQYITGTIVRFDIPLTNGMQQLVGSTYPIIVTGNTTFIVALDSTSFQPFTNTNCAMVVPVGELNGQLTAAMQNVLPYPAT